MQPTIETMESTTPQPPPTTLFEPHQHEPAPKFGQEQDATELESSPTLNEQTEPDPKPTEPSVLHIFYDA